MIRIPPPPHKARNTHLLAGMGYSTVLADFDFETTSTAGYLWNDALNKWVSPPGAPGTKRGLEVVGSAAYSEHPSTDVLTLAYDLKDGLGARVWLPGLPNPTDLFDHLARGELLEAWNVAFERLIWTNVCRKRYGWPELPANQLRCAMAKARAFGLAGKLGVTADVLDVDAKKDKDGTRLLKLFSMPHQPSKKDPRRVITMAEEPEDALKLVSYNVDDIRAEADVSRLCPDLVGDELAFWQADQEINARGVCTDQKGIEDCIAIIEQAHSLYNTELAELTGGAVMRASELSKLKEWLHGHGVHMDDMDEDAIAAQLSRLGETVQDGTLHETEVFAPYRALEIRQAVGSASVKKVFAMRLQASADHRVRGVFNYHAARTGRATAYGPQPQNLPKAGPKVYLCGCGKHSNNPTHCTWCRAPRAPGKTGKVESVEWTVNAVEDALTAIASRDLATVQHHFGDAMLAVSGCLRSLFVAGPGKTLVSSDFTAIEAVVLAALAGEQWRLDVFKAKTDIYLESISRSTGTPVEEMKAFKKERGMHHPLRQKGKVQELACLTAHTQVLTNRGYLDIVDVQLTDLLWDGQEWVTHKGLVSKGTKEVVSLDGTEMTPNHLIFSNGSWKEARQLVSNESILCRALETGSENLPWLALGREESTPRSTFDVPAAPSPTLLTSTISEQENQLGVTPAQSKRPSLREKCSTSIRQPCRMTSTGADCLTDSQLAATGATTRTTQATPTMVVEVSASTPIGSKTKPSSLPTSSPCRGGTSPTLSLTESMLTEGTSPATFDLSPEAKTCSTREAFRLCSGESTSLKPVYDIAHAGPRNRFTIRTNSGHLIVHNCGYGGWIGGMRAFGAEGTDDELKQQLLAWRAASPAVVEFWGGQSRDFGRTPGMFGLEGAAVMAVQNKGQWFAVPRLDGTLSGIKYGVEGDVLYCELPSGRMLAYHRPRLAPAEKSWRGMELSFEGYNTNQKKGATGWMRMGLYSGLLAENCTQAVARDVLRHAILGLERAGYPVVLHVHDEIVSEVPIGYGSIEEFERIMSTMPAWAEGWPIAAHGGWVHRRYQKA